MFNEIMLETPVCKANISNCPSSSFANQLETQDILNLSLNLITNVPGGFDE